MDLIETIFYIKIKYEDIEDEISLPNYLKSRYVIKKAWFDQQSVFLLFPKFELDSLSTLKKHIERMQAIEKIPVVFMLEKISAGKRRGMLENQIPFIVGNKQCFLPFLGMLLTQRCDAEETEKEKLIPSAQMLLFYYIYHQKKELYTNTAVTKLGVSAMTITRAVRNLEQLGLIQVFKSGVQKVMTTNFSRKELYNKALPYIQNPIKRTIFIKNKDIDSNLLYAGDSALSQMSMLNDQRIPSYAIDTWKKDFTDTLINDTDQVALQIWKYDPNVLSSEKNVDVFSLAACYMDDEDERIEECIEEMLKEFWENTNDQWT